MRPEYNYKIRAQISLAPVAYVHHMTSVLNSLVPYATQIQVCLNVTYPDHFFRLLKLLNYQYFILFSSRKLQIGFQKVRFYHKMLPAN